MIYTVTFKCKVTFQDTHEHLQEIIGETTQKDLIVNALFYLLPCLYSL